MKIFTIPQMKKAERLSDEMGVTYQRLMENAGCAAASYIRKRLHSIVGKNFMIFCGSGNNGGDGFVVARKLFEEGANVIVVLCGGVPRTDEAKYMYNCILEAGITMLDWSADKKKIDEFIGSADFIIDALFGTGFSGEFRPPFGEVAAEINSAAAPKISLDIASGVNAATGEAAAGSVRAAFTIAFDAQKPGHLLLPGRELCGKTAEVDIGIPHEVLDEIPPTCFCPDEEMVFSSIRRRPRTSHKGTFGRLLCITGCANFPGAAAISAKGALRMGAGIVTVATTERVQSLIAPVIPEATFLPLPANEEGGISASSAEILLPAITRASAVLIGCGLGRTEDTAALVRFVLKAAECPLIIDADALNSVCATPEALLTAKKVPIITPHMGEMARLCKKPPEKIAAARTEIAADFSARYNCVLVLKDASTVIASPNGDIFFNTTGNPGLSKGGSGDILAGMIAALAAQGFIETASAVCGVYLHGLAADKAADSLSEYGMLPSDIPAYLCRILASHEL